MMYQRLIRALQKGPNPPTYDAMLSADRLLGALDRDRAKPEVERTEAGGVRIYFRNRIELEIDIAPSGRIESMHVRYPDGRDQWVA